MKRVLSFDYGASSGRAIIFTHDGDKITAEEIYRFDNIPVKKDGTLYWNFDLLVGALREGIAIAAAKGGFDSVGIDTWGVDFGLLDENGELIDSPVHYRDARTDDIPDEVFDVIPKNELYSLTGVQIQPYNTIFSCITSKSTAPIFTKKRLRFCLCPTFSPTF